jgi:hypothetical protein
MKKIATVEFVVLVLLAATCTDLTDALLMVLTYNPS